MVVPQPGRAPLYQTNTGSGTLINGDMYGNIEAIDAKTKAVLDKLSIEAPQVARLLTKALRDGLISPDVASALEMAARNLNWDVAEALYIAGRNINHDVALQLEHAGRNINEDVAHRIATAASKLEAAANQFGGARETAQSLSNAATNIVNLQGTVAALSDASQNLAYAANQVTTGNWSWTSFRWGMACCFIAIVGVLLLYGWAGGR